MRRPVQKLAKRHQGPKALYYAKTLRSLPCLKGVNIKCQQTAVDSSCSMCTTPSVMMYTHFDCNLMRNVL